MDKIRHEDQSKHHQCECQKFEFFVWGTGFQSIISVNVDKLKIVFGELVAFKISSDWKI